MASSDERLMRIANATTQSPASGEVYLYLEMLPLPGVGGMPDYRTIPLSSGSITLQRGGEIELRSILTAAGKSEASDPSELVDCVVLFGRGGDGRGIWRKPVTDNLARDYFAQERASQPTAAQAA